MKWGQLALVVVAVVLWGRYADAQEMAPECATTDDTAALYQSARAYYAKGEFARAYYCYQKHFKLQPSYDVAANMGNIEVSQLGKYADGARHLAYARQHVPSSLDETSRKQVLDKINERLGEAMAHLGTFRLSAWPRDAEVWVDDELVGRSPLTTPVFLEPGTHSLRVSHAGHAPQSSTLDAKAGLEQSLEVVLVPSSGDATPTPKPGEAATPGETPTPAPADASEEGGVSPLVWIGFGIGAAGLITGAVAGGITLSRGSEIETRCPGGQCDVADTVLADDHDAALLSAHVSTAGFAVAGAGVVVGVIGLLLGDGSEATASESRRWRPLIGPGGFSVVGSF